MDITPNIQETTLTLTLNGTLDSTTAETLSEALDHFLTADITALRLDLTGVDYVSSAGLRMMVRAWHLLPSHQVTLVAPNPTVKEVLKLSGMNKYFQMEEA